MERHKGLLVALAALAVVAALLWAGDHTNFDGAVYGTTFHASSHTYTAGTDSVGQLLCYGNASFTTGDVTVSAGDFEVTAGSAMIVCAIDSVQGNLPTAADHTGEFYRNATGDTLWYADNDSWVQLAP